MGKVLTIVGPTKVANGSFAQFEATTNNMPADAGQIRWAIREATQANPKPWKRRGYLQTLMLYGHGSTSLEVQASSPTHDSLSVVVDLDPVNVVLPGITDLQPQIKPDPRNVCARFTAAIAPFSASGVPDITVGTTVAYRPKKSPLRFGLQLDATYAPECYSAELYFAQYGQWARVLEPTAAVEGGGSFATLNTYDTADFTFGFMQFGAHTYKRNFHSLLIALMTQRQAVAQYVLPSMKLRSDGEIMGYDPNLKQWLQLTLPKVADHPENFALRKFLKPDPGNVTLQEADIAARLVFWTRFDPEAQRIQVEVAKQEGQKKLADFANTPTLQKALDTQPDWICVWVHDLMHQGLMGVKKSAITSALAEPNDDKREAALMAVKRQVLINMGVPAPKPHQRTRVELLKAAIDASRQKGLLGTTRYDVKSAEFV